MAVLPPSDTLPVAAKDPGKRRLRRWIGVLVVLALLILTGIRIGDVDARAEVLLGAWAATWTAAAIWLLTDLKRWIWKVFFGVSVLSSFGGATVGLGLWHAECFEHGDQTPNGSYYVSYCLPRLGPSPDFR